MFPKVSNSKVDSVSENSASLSHIKVLSEVEFYLS